ncbi:MAG: thioredoxin domain-containing protein [Deltaproteobacteria bacterium]|nr:thioredoxin domain-containing protein [Deltaproteobacteria bacterium]
MKTKGNLISLISVIFILLVGMTALAFTPLAPKSNVDVSQIPLNEALVMGDANALKKVIVFTDPDCSYCGKLHEEINKIVSTRTDIVFFIKLYPLPRHGKIINKNLS